jgi:quinol monooxygenase YgiN
MISVHVFIDIKVEYIEEFKRATIENAENSIKEAGVIYFNVIQEQEDTSKFVLMEAYHTADDQAKHRETLHYKKWRETIADMLVKPYSFIRYNSIFPTK